MNEEESAVACIAWQRAKLSTILCHNVIHMGENASGMQAVNYPVPCSPKVILVSFQSHLIWGVNVMFKPVGEEQLAMEVVHTSKYGEIKPRLSKIAMCPEL